MGPRKEARGVLRLRSGPVQPRRQLPLRARQLGAAVTHKEATVVEEAPDAAQSLVVPQKMYRLMAAP